MAVNSMMAPFKGQGHFMVKVRCKKIHRFYQINSKLGVKVACGLPLS
jgi:hypothetical protein